MLRHSNKKKRKREKRYRALQDQDILHLKINLNIYALPKLNYILLLNEEREVNLSGKKYSKLLRKMQGEKLKAETNKHVTLARPAENPCLSNLPILTSDDFPERKS